jgi:hypothetical protein
MAIGEVKSFQFEDFKASMVPSRSNAKVLSQKIIAASRKIAGVSQA